MQPHDLKKELVAGNIWYGIWKISWPMFLIMIFNFLVGFFDVYVAGFISPEVQAALGFVAQIYFLIIILGNAISIGTIALVSRATGSGDRARALAIARQSLITGFITAAILMLLGLTFSREIVAIAGFPAEIRPIAEFFLKIFSIALGPNYVLIISNAVFQASGEVRRPLLTMSLVGAINIFSVFALVFGIFPFPELGYHGIAISTAISVSIGMVINLVQFSSGHWRPLYSGAWRISRETIRKIMDLGWPAALLQIAWNAGTIVLYNILGRLGSESVPALAAITNGLRIEAVIYLPAFALNMAASVLMGQNLGARDSERAERTGWKIAMIGVVLMTVMATVIFILADRFASILTKDSGVLVETVRYLKFNMLSEPFMALSVVLGGALQGAGDTRGTMLVIVSAMWLIRLPLAFVFALVLGYGAVGVWAAMIISMAVQGILMAHRFQKGKWKKLQVS